MTTEAPTQRTDFLDATLDLSSDKYLAYIKDNNKPLYINAKSNHPPSVIKQVPRSVMSRIARLSCDQGEYDKAIPLYKEALEASGHQTPDQPINPTPRTKRQRRRNIIWFNPPYNQNVKTNVGKLFLELIDKHFHSGNPLHKLFNRKTVKVSYSCMQNMGSIIAAHNAKILSAKPPPAAPAKLCNCTGKSLPCVLNGKCLTQSIVYKATVTAPGTPCKVYFGLTADTFKKRYGVHKQSFKHKDRNPTALSIYVWELKSRGKTASIEWEIASKAIPYQCGTRKCDLCNVEKTAIALADVGSLLNRKSEIVSTCLHRSEFTCKGYIERLQKRSGHHR